MTEDDYFWLSTINKASVVTNLDNNLITTEEAKIAAKAIKELDEESLVNDALHVNLYIKYEPFFLAKTGPSGSVIHAGRSSQDILSTVRTALIRSDLITLSETLSSLVCSLVEKAKINKEVLVPNYTNGVAAQPNSFAHYLSGHIEGLLRDNERIYQALKRFNKCSLGSCVLNGTRWNLNREELARLLGFSAPVRHAMDATSIFPNDFPLEVSQICTSIAIHIDAVLEDLSQQYSQANPWILLVEGAETTYISSAMPQKRNPGLLNNCRCAVSDVLGLATTTMLRLHNLPTGMIDGKNSHKNHETVTSTINLISLFKKVIEALKVNPQRALQELNSDWTASQEIADRLMDEYAIPFRVGHHAVSQYISFAKAKGITPLTAKYDDFKRIFEEVTKAELGQIKVLQMSEEDFFDAINPRSIINAKKTSGSAAPTEVCLLLEEMSSQNASQSAHIRKLKASICSALQELKTRFSNCLNEEISNE